MFRFRNESFSPAIGLILALVLALLWPVVDAVAQKSPTPIKIGVLAKRGHKRCVEKWGPTAEYLTNEIPGYSFSIVPLDYDEIRPAVTREEVDFILTNPSSYVELEKSHRVIRIATLINLRMGKPLTVFGGVIFRRADRTDIKNLNDLKEKIFMAVDKGSLGGWLAAWRELKEKGIDPYQDFADLWFGGTQDAVV